VILDHHEPATALPRAGLDRRGVDGLHRVQVDDPDRDPLRREQIVGAQRLPFSDQEEIAKALAERWGGAGEA
jgi:hypothetical protein